MGERGGGDPPSKKGPTNGVVSGHTVAAATGGVAISMALFTTLKVGDIFSNPTYGPTYALAIFFGVALIVLIAGVFTLPDAFLQNRRGIVYCGIAVIALLTAAFSAPFVKEGLTSPVISIQGSFQPDIATFKDADTETPVTLAANLYNAGNTPTPLSEIAKTIWVDSSNPVTIEVASLSALEQKYLSALSQLQTERHGAQTMKNQMAQLCANQPAQDSQICFLARTTPDY